MIIVRIVSALDIWIILIFNRRGVVYRTRMLAQSVLALARIWDSILYVSATNAGESSIADYASNYSVYIGAICRAVSAAGATQCCYRIFIANAASYV